MAPMVAVGAHVWIRDEGVLRLPTPDSGTRSRVLGLKRDTVRRFDTCTQCVFETHRTCHMTVHKVC